MIWVVGFACPLLLTSCKNKAVEETAPVYPVVSVAVSSVEMTDDFPATIQGRQDIAIYPQVSGTIKKVCVHEGEKVREGQLLFVIDQVPYQAALRTAIANVHAAEAQVKTAELVRDSKRDLFEQQIISEYDYSTACNSLAEAQAALEQAQAQETNARNSLSYTEVKSPADGVVGTIPYRVGALVSSSISTPLTTVSDNSEMYVYFSMPERRMLGIVRRYGTVEKALAQMPAVQLKLADGLVYEEEGRVETISGVIDAQTGSVSFRAVFPNQGGLLHSGGAGNVLITESLENVLTIPQAAPTSCRTRSMPTRSWTTWSIPLGLRSPLCRNRNFTWFIPVWKKEKSSWPKESVCSGTKQGLPSNKSRRYRSWLGFRKENHLGGNPAGGWHGSDWFVLCKNTIKEE